MSGTLLPIPPENAEELYENAPCGYLSALPGGQIVRVNGTFLKMSGFKADDLLNKRKFQELLTVAGRVFYDTHFAPLIRMQGFIKEIACDIVTAPGGSIPVLVNAVQVADDKGDPGLIRYTIFEATERRRYERDLLEARRSAERYSTIVRSSADPIVSLDPEGCVSTMNPSAESLFNIKIDEAAGRNLSELLVGAEDHDNVLASAMDALRRGGTVRDIGPLVLRTGETRVLSYTFTPHIEPPGELTGISAILRDLTDVRHAEEEKNRRLLAENLVETQERERRRIARDLHDEVGQQVTGLALLLADLRTAHGFNDEACEKLRLMEERLGELDEDLTYIAFELRPPSLGSTHIYAALESLASEWSRRHAGTTISVHVGARSRPSLNDEIETNLYRIAQEALHNIAKHAKANNVNITIDVTKTTARLIVEDDGQGFNPMAMSGAPTKAGHGFGVAGMRERATIIGGTLEIESSPGNGTAVLVTVPLPM